MRGGDADCCGAELRVSVLVYAMRMIWKETELTLMASMAYSTAIHQYNFQRGHPINTNLGTVVPVTLAAFARLVARAYLG